MDIDFSSLVTEILQEAAIELKLFFTNLVRSERMIESGEYSDNPEEAAQMQVEIDATEVELHVEGTSISAKIITSGSNYDKISTEGQGESYSGGQNGLVTKPDETVVPSKVVPQFWGQPVLDSAEPPSVWKENSIKKMNSLLPSQLEDYVKSRLGEKLPPVIGKYFSSMLTGGVT